MERLFCWKALKRLRESGQSAFSMVEIMIAVSVLAIVFIGSIQASQMSQVVQKQAKETQIATAFLQDYMENLMALRYSDVQNSASVKLLDGARTIPASNAWVTCETNDFNAFPELASLVKGTTSPEYQVQITPVSTLPAGVTWTFPIGVSAPYYKDITLSIRWPGVRALRNASARSTVTLTARRYVHSISYL